MNKYSNDYPWLFEGKYGFFLRSVLQSIFAHFNIPELYNKSISSLGKNGHIVYAHSTKSVVDLMLINSRFQKENLPVPRFIFQHKFRLWQPVCKLGSILKSLIVKDSTPFENGFYQHFADQKDNASLIFLNDSNAEGHIIDLLKIQKTTQKPIYIVPQRLIYNRTPVKVKDATKEDKAQIGVIKKLSTLSRAREQGFIEHAEALNLMEYVTRSKDEAKLIEEIAKDIKNELMQRLSVLGSNISGAHLRDRGFLIKKTVKDAILQSFLKTYAQENNTSVADLEKKVEKFLDQIAANIQPGWINFLNKALTWIFNNIYEGLDVNQEGIQKIKQMARNGSLVFVPCHKSHTDYLLLSYCLFHNWMSVPVIAAGINLAFFPMGYILKRGGAFFMQRTFKGNPLYAQTFAAYVRTILGERIPIEFFIEGSRSRSGKLMMPKKGLLSMIVQAWDYGVGRDVIFVPVYVGYDIVVEENSYIREMKGAPKEKENLWQLLKAGNILKNRYGKVYIRFADPLSLNDYMKQQNKYADMDEEQRKSLYDNLAQVIINSIYQQTVATPFSILSCVLMSQSSALEENEIKTVFKIFIDYLKNLGCNLSSSFSSLDDMENAFNESISLIKEKGLVSVDEGEGPEDPNIYVVNGDDRIHLEYYKNSILNFFVPGSLITNVLLRYPHGLAHKTFNQEVKSLANFLENEFILDMPSLEASLEYMLLSRIIINSQSMYFIDRNKKHIALMFAGLIENYLESYYAVATSIIKGKAKGKGTKDILKTINRYASRMHKKGEIKRSEALCLPAYKGALDTFQAKGLINNDFAIINEEAIQEISREIEAYLED